MNLSSLEIDLKGTPISSLLIGALPSTLRLLRVVSMAQVSAKDLASIAINCRDLEGLEVSVTDKLEGSCCWQCFEESESCVVHSPIGHGKRARTFEEVIDAYAKALHPLTRLRRLALGVFVSPASVLTTHLDVHRADAQPFTTKGTPAYDIASAQNTPAVASSPRVKMSDYQLVQAPPATNIRDHVERFGRFATPTRCMDCVNEHSEIVRRDELRAAVRLAQRLKSLESVWWSSWFSGDDRQGSAGAMWTRLSVVREGTRMKVSRQRRV